LGNQKLPAVSASASKDKQGVTHISLVNIDASKTQTIEVDLRGGKFNGTITGRILTSGKIQDHNTFEKPETVKPAVFKNFKKTDNLLSVTLPPFSVIVLEIR
jgi:alpha-N-arabinofuranosidase